MPKRPHHRKIELDELYARDCAQCWICVLLGKPYTECYVKRSEASRDHFDPLADGGSDDNYNLRLAHIKCNNKRGTKTIQQLVDDEVRMGNIDPEGLRIITTNLNNMIFTALYQRDK